MVCAVDFAFRLSVFFFFEVIGIGYVIRLIPSRYEEEYIDRSIADCVRCSFICRLPSANIRRIHARCRNNFAITQTRYAFVLRCGTPIKMDVDICENDTAIGNALFAIVFTIRFIFAGFQRYAFDHNTVIPAIRSSDMPHTRLFLLD